MEIPRLANLTLEILTWDLRATTREQLARILEARLFRPVSVPSILRRLSETGEVNTAIKVVAVLKITKPLFVWSPQQSPPDFHTLAWKLEKRWKAVRPQRATLCWATEKGARRTGGVACFAKRATQIDHDLGVAAVYTHLHQSQSLKAEGWIGEDILQRDYAPREKWLAKIPDAAIYRSERLQSIVEFGGQYSVDRLRRFHRHSQRFNLPYFLY